MIIKKFGKTFILKQWKGEKLQDEVSLDTETEKIEYIGHIPRLVLTCAYDGGNTCYIITNSKLNSFLELHKNHTLIFHNCPFDLSVITNFCGFKFWDMIESGRLIDTSVLFQLVAIATRGFTHKKWSLDYCVSNLLNDVLPKDESIRLTFGQFIREDNTIDYKAITKDHYIYACLDPIATHLIYLNLKNTIKGLQTNTNLAHTIHLMGHIALYDINKRGIGVDLDYVNKLRNEIQNEMNIEAEILASYGWTRGQEGNQETYNQICAFLELDLPRTSNGYSMSAEHLAKYNNVPFVQSLLKFLELEKKKSFLNEMTSERIHPYYDPIKNTGRTSAKGPNIQNPPRKGGIRESMVPKEGHIFVDADYGSIEMYTIADIMRQKGFGRTLFDVLNAGKDPHLFAGSIIYNKPESEVTKDQRQASKIANYGFLADMSPETFIDYAGQFGISFTLKEAKKIKKGWTEAYPEVKKFWKSQYKSGGLFKSTTGFLRAGCSYTAWLNTHFQGRAAEGAKIALYLCYKAGLPMVAFVHDQIVLESPLEKKEEHSKLLKECMIEGMKKVCDMNIQVDVEIKERYGK